MEITYTSSVVVSPSVVLPATITKPDSLFVRGNEVPRTLHALDSVAAGVSGLGVVDCF